ncbi:MAG: rod shape-determining protein MreD [bacterium]|nr:rod shape-determining protein MreD [bacterium]
MKKAILAIFFLYLLALIQASFLPNFQFWGFAPNFVLALVVLINLFEGPQENVGVAAAFFGGFFLDIFSGRFFGFWIVILLASAIFIKYLFKKYFQSPSFHFGSRR